MAILIVVLSASANARAQEHAREERCPGIEDASEELAERSPEDRAAFILREARGVDESARVWSATFALLYTGLAAGQLGALAASTDQGTRVDMAIGAISSLIGVGSIFLLPVRVLTDRLEIERLAPAAAAGDCAALARLEAILESDAAGEDFGSSWMMHVGSILFNVGIGLVLGLGYDRWQSGMISAAIGIAVGELQLLTKPRGMIDALERYRTGDFESPSITIVPVVDATFGGLSVAGEFP